MSDSANDPPRRRRTDSTPAHASADQELHEITANGQRNVLPFARPVQPKPKPLGLTVSLRVTRADGE